MRVGYTTLVGDPKEKTRLSEEGKCDKVEVITDDVYTVDIFIDFLKRYSRNTVVVTSIEAINLSLTHYNQIERVVKEFNITLQFLDRELSSDKAYLSCLGSLAKRETKMMSRRTFKGLEKARESGKVGGRPQIDSRKINQIQRLYTYQKKTLREIADECQVSLGTVHKYTRIDKQKGKSKM